MTDTQTPTLATQLGELRYQLVDAEADVLRATDELKTVQAQREVAIIEGSYGGDIKNLGTNEHQRDVNMTTELSLDAEYQQACEKLFTARHTRDLLRARIEALRDLRREKELQVWDRIADRPLVISPLGDTNGR